MFSFNQFNDSNYIKLTAVTADSGRSTLREQLLEYDSESRSYMGKSRGSEGEYQNVSITFTHFACNIMLFLSYTLSPQSTE